MNKKKTKEDLLSKNFWWEDCMKELDSWIAFYYHFGKSPGSANFTVVPRVSMPGFFKNRNATFTPSLT